MSTSVDLFTFKVGEGGFHRAYSYPMKEVQALAADLGMDLTIDKGFIWFLKQALVTVLPQGSVTAQERRPLLYLFRAAFARLVRTANETATKASPQSETSSLKPQSEPATSYSDLLKKTESRTDLPESDRVALAMKDAELFYETLLTGAKVPESIARSLEYRCVDPKVVRAVAEALGIAEDYRLLWIARLFCVLPLPPLWQRSVDAFHSELYLNLLHSIAVKQHPSKTYFYKYIKRLQFEALEEQTTMTFLDSQFHEYEVDLRRLVEGSQDYIIRVNSEPVMDALSQAKQFQMRAKVTETLNELMVLEIAESCGVQLEEEIHLLGVVFAHFAEMQKKGEFVGWEFSYSAGGQKYWYHPQTQRAMKSYPFRKMLKIIISNARIRYFHRYEEMTKQPSELHPVFSDKSPQFLSSIREDAAMLMLSHVKQVMQEEEKEAIDIATVLRKFDAEVTMEKERWQRVIFACPFRFSTKWLDSSDFLPSEWEDDSNMSAIELEDVRDMLEDIKKDSQHMDNLTEMIKKRALQGLFMRPKVRTYSVRPSKMQISPILPGNEQGQGGSFLVNLLRKGSRSSRRSTSSRPSIRATEAVPTPTVPVPTSPPSVPVPTSPSTASVPVLSPPPASPALPSAVSTLSRETTAQRLTREHIDSMGIYIREEDKLQEPTPLRRKSSRIAEELAKRKLSILEGKNAENVEKVREKLGVLEKVDQGKIVEVQKNMMKSEKNAEKIDKVNLEMTIQTEKNEEKSEIDGKNTAKKAEIKSKLPEINQKSEIKAEKTPESADFEQKRVQISSEIAKTADLIPDNWPKTEEVTHIRPENSKIAAEKPKNQLISPISEDKLSENLVESPKKAEKKEINEDSEEKIDQKAKKSPLKPIILPETEEFPPISIAKTPQFGEIPIKTSKNPPLSPVKSIQITPFNPNSPVSPEETAKTPYLPEVVDFLPVMGRENPVPRSEDYVESAPQTTADVTPRQHSPMDLPAPVTVNEIVDPLSIPTKQSSTGSIPSPNTPFHRQRESDISTIHQALQSLVDKNRQETPEKPLKTSNSQSILEALKLERARKIAIEREEEDLESGFSSVPQTKPSPILSETRQKKEKPPVVYKEEPRVTKSVEPVRSSISLHDQVRSTEGETPLSVPELRIKLPTPETSPPATAPVSPQRLKMEAQKRGRLRTIVEEISPQPSPILPRNPLSFPHPLISAKVPFLPQLPLKTDRKREVSSHKRSISGSKTERSPNFDSLKSSFSIYFSGSTLDTYRDEDCLQYYLDRVGNPFVRVDVSLYRPGVELTPGHVVQMGRRIGVKASMHSFESTESDLLYIPYLQLCVPPPSSPSLSLSATVALPVGKHPGDAFFQAMLEYHRARRYSELRKMTKNDRIKSLLENSWLEFRTTSGNSYKHNFLTGEDRQTSSLSVLRFNKPRNLPSPMTHSQKPPLQTQKMLPVVSTEELQGVMQVKRIQKRRELRISL